MKRLKPALAKNSDPLVMDSTSLVALAALLALVQLPHVLNLPIWISVFSLAVIALRVYARGTPFNKCWNYIFSPFAITITAVVGAALIRLHYGYFLGRDPCVAFLFLLISLKFGEYRRSADATLLIGLACVLLLTQYFYSQSLLSAVVTVPAVFAIGHALAVLRDPTHPLAKKPQLRLVGKLLLQGLPIALVLFVLFPRLPGPLWSIPDDAVGKTGLSDTMSPGDIGTLSQSSEVAFRVEFNTSPPPPDARYWRGPVLTKFDGFTWSPDKTITENHPQMDVSEALEYTVMLQPHKQNWLFALDQAVSIPGKDGTITSGGQASTFATLTTSGQLLAKEPVTRVTRYTQRSSLSNQFQSTVRPNAAETDYPLNMPRTEHLARKLLAESSSPLNYANRVMQRFNQLNYHYTLQPGLLGNNPVDEFLFDTQLGYCEHYSSAFTMMMRAAGIPARVVTGYLGGEMNEDYMIVRQSDAHAWSEAYIDGRWHRFDPTAAVAPERVENGVRAALPEGELSRLSNINSYSWTKTIGLTWDSVNHKWQRMVVDYNNRSQDNLLKKIGLPSLTAWQITAIILSIAGFWCLWILRSPLQRRKAPTLPADRVWKKLEALLSTHGVKREPSETPSAFLDRACEELNECSEDIRKIGTTLLSARFAALDINIASKKAMEASKQIKLLHKRIGA